MTRRKKLVEQAKNNEGDPDPTNLHGLLYRLLSRPKMLISAVLILVAIGMVMVGVIRLANAVRIDIGPVGVEVIAPTVLPTL